MRTTVLIAAFAVSLGACREREGNDVDTAIDTVATAVTPQFGDTALDAPARRDSAAKAEPTPDGTVLGAFIAASRHEVQHGRLAEQKASSQTVRDLGRTIARDHDDFVANAQALGKRIGVAATTQASDTSVSGHRGVMGDLRNASGAQFDRIFLEHEIEYHRWLIDLVNTTMLPRAANAELKTFLEQAVPAFQAHLKAAQDLLSKPTP
ncbi:MAG TPA: DUF4142 domain-containing protein [Gemmatimonadaceae bacterium]|nr:DUF4142 domain-containing protein [Gemmatimonadaceae bacterium]